MKLFKKVNSRFYWYDFTVAAESLPRGQRKKQMQPVRQKIAGLKLAEATEGAALLPKKDPLLFDFSRRFLESLGKTRLEEKTKTYYEGGWRLLAVTDITGMRLNQITADITATLKCPGSLSKYSLQHLDDKQQCYCECDIAICRVWFYPFKS